MIPFKDFSTLKDCVKSQILMFWHSKQKMLHLDFILNDYFDGMLASRFSNKGFWSGLIYFFKGHTYVHILNIYLAS